MGVPDEAAIRGLCCYRENHVTDDKRGLGLCKNVIGSVCGAPPCGCFMSRISSCSVRVREISLSLLCHICARLYITTLVYIRLE